MRPVEPKILTKCPFMDRRPVKTFTDPCTDNPVQERICVGILLIQDASYHLWARRDGQEKRPNFNLKIFEYAPEFHFIFPFIFKIRFLLSQQTCPP